MSVNSHFYSALNRQTSSLQEDLIIVNRRLLALLDSVSLFQQHAEESVAFEHSPNEEHHPLKNHTAHYTVLLIEDNATAQHIAQSQLHQFNCDVMTADSMEAALPLLKKQRYNLVLVDIGLPDGDGRQIVREIRRDSDCPNRETPVIALTAHLPDNEKHTCYDAGIDYILYKPLTRDNLHAIFDTFLGSQFSENGEEPSSDDTSIEEEKTLNTLPVIDLARSAKLMHCDEENVKRLLTMLVESLPEEQVAMETAYQNSAWGDLRKVVHKLNGGSSYCGVPRLKVICAELETALVTAPDDTKTIQHLYQQLLKEIAAILTAFASL